ncbi:MAG TPA: sigma-70 family RNA polymerase sigma factor [Clostridiaceae bacterium]|nr:sigma-70 family RNA polymerase sigma factor [Clostridiaceae bacterium]
MEASDHELVRRCLAGSQDSFAELVTRYKKLIYGVVYNMINDKEEANDVSQEAFLRIYKALARYNPEYKFSTWAVKIATNLCLDILRKKKHDSMPIEEIENASNDADTPEESYLKKERLELIRKAVSELPDKYRIPIILFHQNGLSYEEITKVLGEPMTIVKNRLYRARLMLKEKLSEERKEEIL